jgi:peroxin-14
VQRSGGYGFQPQTSNERLGAGTRGSYQGGSSNHHAGNAMDDPAAVAAEFQRRWVPPQPPGVIMPEAAAAIRQVRSVPRQQPGDGRLSTDVPRPSESAMATTEHMNGAPEAPGGELPSDDGGAMTANASSGGASEE